MTQGVWICSACRSVNTARSDQCYSCHAWRRATAVAPEAIPTVGRSAPALAPAGHRYRSSLLRALICEGVILGTIFTIIFAWWFAYQAVVARYDQANPAHADQILAQGEPFFIALPILILATLVTWGAWISRVVDNLPALGAGYSRATPRIAFIENIVPGVNLLRLPARVSEVTRLLHPTGGGNGLLTVAWLVMYAGWFLFIVVDRIALYAGVNVRDFAHMSTVLLGLVAATTVFGLMVTVAILSRVEKLADYRARAIARAAEAVPSPPVSGTTR